MRRLSLARGLSLLASMTIKPCQASGGDDLPPRVLREEPLVFVSGSNSLDVEQLPPPARGFAGPVKAAVHGRGLQAGADTILASKVRVQHNGRSDEIALREVEVFDKLGTNVALNTTGAVAKQSVTYDLSGVYLTADNGNDGVIDNGQTSALAATGQSYDSWWEVDLGNSYDIQEVKLYNRIDYPDLQNRLNNSTISLWDGDSILASVDIGDASGSDLLSFNASQFIPVPWDIQFSSLASNFTTTSEDELVLDYLIGKDRPYKSSLYEKDCTTSVTDGNFINVTKTLSRLVGSYNSISLAYNIDKSAIGNSSIWNKVNNKIELCQVVQLTYNASGTELVIAEDIRNVTIDFDLTANFTADIDLAGATIYSNESSTSVDGYIVAFHCDGRSMAKVEEDLAPNNALDVCIQSTSEDFQIEKLNKMDIKGKDSNDAPETLPVVVDDVASIPSITSITYINATNVLVSTRVPSNVFDFESANAFIVVEGGLTVKLAGSTRKLTLAGINVGRKLQADTGPAELGADGEGSFEVSIDLKPEGSAVDDSEGIAMMSSARGLGRKGPGLVAALAATYAVW